MTDNTPMILVKLPSSIGTNSSRSRLLRAYAPHRNLPDRASKRAIPIVFAGVADPVGSGFITSLAWPGGSITGVMQYDASVTGKWLVMLKEISPTLMRAVFVVNPRTAPYYNYYLLTAESLSRSLGIELVPTLV